MIDFGKTAKDYARYRVPFAPRLFDRLAEFGIGIEGQRIVDVGAGTGLIAMAMSQRGCNVISIDSSLELLTEASSNSPRMVARAEALPLADECADVVIAAQCWHWFDREIAPREIHRVLRPEGKIAVIYQTYIPLPGSVAERTESLILRHRPRWRHANSTGINGQVLRDLQINGFGGIESFSFDVAIEFTREGWRGFTRTTSAVGASMPRESLAHFELEHQALLQGFPEPLPIPHRLFAVLARKSSSRV